MTARASGLIVDIEGTRRFVAASLAIRAVQRPPVTPVPGAPLGIALVDGLVVPVLELGPDPAELLLCQVQGQLVALAGIRVVRSGLFRTLEDAVELDGKRIRVLDVEAELRSLEQRVGAVRLGEVP